MWANIAMTMDPMGFPFQFELGQKVEVPVIPFQADNDEESQTAQPVAPAAPQAQAGSTEVLATVRRLGDASPILFGQ